MSATTSTTPAVGALIDERYQLESMLGEGTFGGVWRARDTRLSGRPVAVKFLKAEFIEHAGAVSRFDAEADALAQLSHPNIVVVIDRGGRTHQRYIVMEFVEGRSLAEWIRERRDAGVTPDPREAFAIFDQVCAGIEAAHAVRSPGPIVHRDLKPDNVILRTLPGGELSVKVLDFGIAQLGRRKGTQTGALMGTPLYMAPEQAMGQVAAIGPWTDVFSLGVLLVEMLTTEPQPNADEPWWGASLQRASTLREALTAKRPDIPEGVWRVVARCFCAQGSERFSDAGSLRSSLRVAVSEAYGMFSPSLVPSLGSTPPGAQSPRARPTPDGRATPPLPAANFNWLTAGAASDNTDARGAAAGDASKPAASVAAGVVTGAEAGVAADRDPPWMKLTAVVIVGAVLAAVAIVAALVFLDQRKHGTPPEAATHHPRTAASVQGETPHAPTPFVTTPAQPLAQNASLGDFVTTWARTRRAEPGARPVEALYSTSLKYHGSSRTPDFAAMARDMARVTAEGGSFTVDAARSDWSREDPNADAVPAACRTVPDATGAVVKVRAWAVEVRNDRNADIGCPRLEGRYLLRMRETPAGLRICHESWSVDEGICASCPTAPMCARRRD